MPRKASFALPIFVRRYRKIAQSRQAQTDPMQGRGCVAVAFTGLDCRCVDDANFRAKGIGAELGHVAAAYRCRTVGQYGKTAGRLVEQADRPSRSVRKHQFALHRIADGESMGLTSLVLQLLRAHDGPIRSGTLRVLAAKL